MEVNWKNGPNTLKQVGVTSGTTNRRHSKLSSLNGTLLKPSKILKSKLKGFRV